METEPVPSAGDWRDKYIAWMDRRSCPLLTQNSHLTPSTQQAEQASFTREKIPRRASQFSLKINKRQSS
jgi:hypothetical protein